MKLLMDLIDIGYEIFLEGGRVKLRYRKPNDPPEIARQLIEELRHHKEDAAEFLRANNNTVPKAALPDSGDMVSEPQGSHFPTVSIGTQKPRPLLIIWRNPFPHGSPEARAESLRVCAAARRGEPI
jgi:hypothetical protein